jgi:adenosine/AMP kinase
MTLFVNNVTVSKLVAGRSRLGNAVDNMEVQVQTYKVSTSSAVIGVIDGYTPRATILLTQRARGTTTLRVVSKGAYPSIRALHAQARC